MKMKYLVFALPLLVFIGCEEEEAAFDCTAEMTAVAEMAFATQLADYMAAAFSGDTSYTQPSDWKSNCEAYQNKMQELFDNDCYTAEDSVTQADIDARGDFCDLEL